ncbi:MAG: carboxypeptidase regulatory-like domain-containing protein [Gemmatimonadales bacterium]
MKICRSRLVALAFVAIPGTSLAQGGTIVGTVRYAAAEPEARVIAVTKNQDTCGETLLSKQLMVVGGRVQYAVVHVEGAKGKTMPEHVTLMNHDCSFDPPIIAATAKSIVEIGNQDPILHNTHLRQRRRTLANLALPHQGDKIQNSRALRRPGIVDVECDTHGWMTAKILVFDHPYFSVSDQAGRFTIVDVPPGTYTVKVWHEILGELDESVTVTAGATTAADFLFGVKTVSGNKGER